MRELLEIRPNITLEETLNRFAIYNYKGIHFRVFFNFKNGQKWLENSDGSLVLVDFDDESELDKWLDEHNRCIYCQTVHKKDELHFQCECCGNGICDDCYEADKEHDEHYNRPYDESDPDYEDLLLKVKKLCGTETPDYICATCNADALKASQ